MYRRLSLKPSRREILPIVGGETKKLNDEFGKSVFGWSQRKYSDGDDIVRPFIRRIVVYLLQTFLIVLAGQKLSVSPRPEFVQRRIDYLFTFQQIQDAILRGGRDYLLLLFGFQKIPDPIFRGERDYLAAKVDSAAAAGRGKTG